MTVRRTSKVSLGPVSPGPVSPGKISSARLSWAKALPLLAAALSGLVAAPALAGDKTPTVVELFTSQGCSSCPPANENVRALAGKPGVLALSYGVTYWDYLGWKDTFASEAYTDRQRSYVRPLGNSSPFTPQVVVNGKRDTVGNRKGQIEALIASEAAGRGAPDVAISGRAVSVSGGSAPRGGADVWLVHYDPRTVDVPIGRGENSGRTLPHRNVVHDLEKIGTWTGGEASFKLSGGGKGLRTAVLVQTPKGGPILGAATN